MAQNPKTEKKPDQTPPAPNPDRSLRLVPIDTVSLPDHPGEWRRRKPPRIGPTAPVGLKKPLFVRSVGEGRYELICGRGSLDALKQAGATMAPVLVWDGDEADLPLMHLVASEAR